VLVVNNTPDPAMWMPIEEHCRLLGDRFKFVNEQNLAGFKAARCDWRKPHTAPDAKSSASSMPTMSCIRTG